MWRSVLLQISGNPAVRYLSTRSALSRRFALRFVAGETLPEALSVARSLNSQGATAELDYLGENVKDARQAKASMETYLRMLDRVSREGLQAHVSLKPTQMGLDLSQELCLVHVEEVVSQAEKLGNFVWLDMEGSDYTDRTLQVYGDLRRRHGNVGVALQSALRRTESDAHSVLSMGGTVRLCKGAYLEPAKVAFPEKHEVDRQFMKLTEMLLASEGFHALATHDEKMIRHALRFAGKKGVRRDRFEFQMLYGVRRDLQRKLMQQDQRVRVYVPFGSEWYPYLVRRLAERPANLLFLMSNLAREARSTK